MLGQDLRAILRDMRRAVGSTKATAEANALARLEEALAPLDSKGLGEVIAHVEAAVDQSTLPRWEQRLRELQEAELQEDRFLAALQQIELDPKVKKADLARIAEAYVGFADKKASEQKLLQAIKTEFFSRAYNRDANEMAKRATPW